MKKYEEALYNIKVVTDFYKGNIKCQKGVEIIQELVDKATPKKVTQFEHEGNLYCWCHECDHVEMIREIDFMNYCPNCGKRLDWSTDE